MLRTKKFELHINRTPETYIRNAALQYSKKGHPVFTECPHQNRKTLKHFLNKKPVTSLLHTAFMVHVPCILYMRLSSCFNSGRSTGEGEVTNTIELTIHTSF